MSEQRIATGQQRSMNSNFGEPAETRWRSRSTFTAGRQAGITADG
jgi:hypothetical protein